MELCYHKANSKHLEYPIVDNQCLYLYINNCIDNLDYTYTMYKFIHMAFYKFDIPYKYLIYTTTILPTSKYLTYLCMYTDNYNISQSHILYTKVLESPPFCQLITIKYNNILYRLVFDCYNLMAGYVGGIEFIFDADGKITKSTKNIKDKVEFNKKFTELIINRKENYPESILSYDN